MTTAGCLNLRGKDGSQSSITVRCVYLPASFFNACSSDYLRTERLFLQRPFASQMVSPVFSHFAVVLLEIRNIAFLENGKGQPRTSDRKSLIGNRRDHYDFMRVLPRVKRLRAENHCCSSLLCSDSLFVFFSPAAFYAQGPRMDRQRVSSIFSSGNSSFRDCFYYFQSAGIRFEALLFNLNLRVSHFSNSKSRKQSAKHRHCSTQEICKFGFFVPTKNQCEKADCQPAHKFISRSNFHFFLRVLGLDFCLTAQILPSTPETNFVRMG